MKTLYECWEYFKNLCRYYPSHLIPQWNLMQAFSKGINPLIKITINTPKGGNIMEKNIRGWFRFV